MPFLYESQPKYSNERHPEQQPWSVVLSSSHSTVRSLVVSDPLVCILSGTARCNLPPAFCLLPPAFCFLLSAFYQLPTPRSRFRASMSVKLCQRKICKHEVRAFLRLNGQFCPMIFISLGSEFFLQPINPLISQEDRSPFPVSFLLASSLQCLTTSRAGVSINYV